MKKKGFTLIELLAVIIILAVIALIATPIVLNVIENSKKEANKDSVYGLIDSAKMYYMDALMNAEKYKNVDGNTDVMDKLKVNGEKPENGSIYINDLGEIAVAVVFDNICYTKEFTQNDLSESDAIENCIVDLGPTTPKLTLNNTTENSITVTATCKDSVAGVKKIEISKDGGQTYSTFNMVNSLAKTSHGSYGITATKETIYEGDLAVHKFTFSNVTNTTSNGAYYTMLNNERLIEGEQYTWSAYVKTSKNLTFRSFGQEQGGTIIPKLASTTEWQKVSYTYTANNNTWKSFIMYGPFEEGDELYVHSVSLTKVDSDNSVGTYQYTFEGLETGTYNIKARCTSHTEKVNESEILEIEI